MVLTMESPSNLDSIESFSVLLMGKDLGKHVLSQPKQVLRVSVTCVDANGTVLIAHHGGALESSANGSVSPRIQLTCMADGEP